MDAKQIEELLGITANNILKKYEDKNEHHFHEVDRKWIIEAMEEYKKSTIALDYIDESEWNKFYKLPDVDSNVIVLYPDGHFNNKVWTAYDNIFFEDYDMYDKPIQILPIRWRYFENK